MKIELTLKRTGGSHIDMGDGKSYHFQPDASGAHVCDVTDPRHIKRLMSVDGFIPAGAEIDDPAVLPAPITGNPTAGATDDDDIIDRIDVTDDEGGEGGEDNGEIIDLAALSDEALAALHVEKVGRAPHPKASRATIEAKIMEAVEAGAA
ncbi:MAG: hypothetical protein F9K30_12000 [Dechloromonas sp.]|nr:MAG: hypothetical protein F9K30_12000 [Dechloromonas sp.]